MYVFPRTSRSKVGLSQSIFHRDGGPLSPGVQRHSNHLMPRSMAGKVIQYLQISVCLLVFSLQWENINNQSKPPTFVVISIHPSIHGTTAPSGPWPSSNFASIVPIFRSNLLYVILRYTGVFKRKSYTQQCKNT